MAVRGRGHTLSTQCSLTDFNHSHRQLRGILARSSTRLVYHQHGRVTLHCAICDRMIPLYQSSTSRERPFDCTARCAPSRFSSLRCGPPLSLLDSARFAKGQAFRTSRWRNFKPRTILTAAPVASWQNSKPTHCPVSRPTRSPTSRRCATPTRFATNYQGGTDSKASSERNTVEDAVKCITDRRIQIQFAADGGHDLYSIGMPDYKSSS